MISVWEEENFYKYDYLIIGAGITGLSTALCLREMTGPGSRISVIDKEVVPGGASTRNAGFACFGSFTEILHDIESYGEDQALDLVENRYRGIRYLIKHLGQKSIGLTKNNGYELIFNRDLANLDKLDEVNNKLRDIFKNQVFHLKNEKIRSFGFNGVSSLISTPFEYQLNPGLLIQVLRNEVQSKNISILSGAEVFEVEEADLYVILYLNNGLKLKAKKVAVCTNAYTPGLFPNEDIIPGRGLILLTNAIPDLPFEGSFHFDMGYYYFRNYQGRVLLGGGRNVDFNAETTYKAGINPKILQDLKNKLQEIVLPERAFQIENCWSGIMAFGREKLPIVKKVSQNIAVGTRLSGMGVALGSQIGQKVAQLLTD